MATKNLPERGVQEMSRSVVSPGCVTCGDVDLGRDQVAFPKNTRADVDTVQARRPTRDAHETFHRRVATTGFTKNGARIRDLATGLQIKGSFLERKVSALSRRELAHLLPLFVKDGQQGNAFDLCGRVAFEPITCGA